jgi:hypothetical protein
VFELTPSIPTQKEEEVADVAGHDPWMPGTIQVPLTSVTEWFWAEMK